MVQTLLDDIINTVNELVFRAVNAIEEGLNNATPESLGFKPDDANGLSEDAKKDALHAAKQTEIDSGIVQLETLLNATVDKDFDKFEIYTLRNILAVGHEEEELAGWVQLDHYKDLELSKSKDAPTPEQVQLQRRKLQETVKLSNMLKAEEARNSAVLAKLQSLLGANKKQEDQSASPLAFFSSLQHTPKNSTNQPLNQNVQYAISQLPALRELLSNLKDSLQTIPNARHTLDDESVLAKRRHYVESQSRRALERKGIDPENPATVAAASGRKIGRDEVEGIEAVVQALGGAAPLIRTEDDMEE